MTQLIEWFSDSLHLSVSQVIVPHSLRRIHSINRHNRAERTNSDISCKTLEYVCSWQIHTHYFIIIKLISVFQWSRSTHRDPSLVNESLQKERLVFVCLTSESSVWHKQKITGYLKTRDGNMSQHNFLFYSKRNCITTGKNALFKTLHWVPK